MMLKEGGIIVVTYTDECGIFVEVIKRFIAHIAIKNVFNYNEKVSAYTKFFSPQFSKLEGMFRSVEDWIKDDMLSPVFFNDDTWSIIDCINMFPKDFCVL